MNRKRIHERSWKSLEDCIDTLHVEFLNFFVVSVYFSIHVVDSKFLPPRATPVRSPLERCSL